ncbi:hypothetical protein OMCYN_00019 [cyanobiont of Ornithocercus magnificus]|nr:hypothetical protein OMCYN_00019 [cyanobiont of Ornithocercus magnificus]
MLAITFIVLMTVIQDYAASVSLEQEESEPYGRSF